MRINLEDKYLITSKGLSLELYQSKRDENGNTVKKDDGSVKWINKPSYYNDMDLLFKSLLRKELVHSNAETLKELREDIKNIKKFIYNSVKDLKFSDKELEELEKIFYS